jgi:glucose/arabinose dehydrogenase
MRLITLLVLAVATVAACGSEAGDSAAAPRTQTIATGLHVPWGIAFLPDGDALVSERTTGKILRIPKGGAIHNGGRIAFGPDGKLYAGVGETGNTGLAQDRGSLNGKILRMNPDGSVPSGNPFGNSLVWSLGHRNVQGLAWDRSGRLWATEFGQNKTDEVNLIRPGRKYGWPEVEGRGNTDGGKFTNPVVTWSPTSTSSPSGDAIVGSRLYVAALQCGCLWQIRLNGTTAGKPRKLPAGRYGRLRTVVRAPDGALWVSTSNRDGRGDPKEGDDRIVRVRP